MSTDNTSASKEKAFKLPPNTKMFYVRKGDTNQTFGLVAYSSEPIFIPDTKIPTGSVKVIYSFSFCNPRDKFTKKLARDIALGRLKKVGKSTYTCTLQCDAERHLHRSILIDIVENTENKLSLPMKHVIVRSFTSDVSVDVGGGMSVGIPRRAIDLAVKLVKNPRAPRPRDR